MRQFTLSGGLIAALLLGASAARGQAVDLPRDPKAVVITLDHQGGGMKRADPEPVLAIHADGSVVVGNPFAIGKRVEAKIPVAEVQALLRYIVQEQHFFDFDEAKAKAAIADEVKKKGMGIGVGGASTTVIRVKTAAKEHEAKYYGLAAFAQHYKDIKALTQLAAVERRLQRVMYESLAGGPNTIAKLLAVANERLKKDYPDARPLTTADLEFARWHAGDLTVRFFRRGERPDLFVAATVMQPDPGAAKATVKAKLK